MTDRHANVVAEYLLTKGAIEVSVKGNGEGKLLEVLVQIYCSPDEGTWTVEGTAVNWDDAWQVLERGVRACMGAHVRAQAAKSPLDFPGVSRIVCDQFGIARESRAAKIVLEWTRADLVTDEQMAALSAIELEYGESLNGITVAQLVAIREMMQRALILGVNRSHYEAG